METVETKPLTAEEFFNLPDPPDGSKLELVRGEVIAVAQPGLEHGEVQVNVAASIKWFLKTTPIGRVFVESGTITERKPDTIRGPDVSYYSKARLPLDKRVVQYHDQPPDLCVEVVSPSNTRRELNAKIKEYFFAEVRMVWVVDPDERSVTVYREPLEGRLLKEDRTLDGGDVLPGFACKVSDLFG